MSFKLKNSGILLPGVAESHETKGGTHPFLLSMASQAKLGLIKNMRRGKAWLEDYDDQLVLARQQGTRLLVTRIDHLVMPNAEMPAGHG